jgi:hypothetical protein
MIGKAKMDWCDFDEKDISPRGGFDLICTRDIAINTLAFPSIPRSATGMCKQTRPQK